MVRSDIAHRMHPQQGAYTLEFAAGFLAFFLLMYGALTYGLLFAAQQSLNLAAENGARKALSWQPSLQDRVAHAQQEVRRATGWVNALGGGDALEVAICVGDAVYADTRLGDCAGQPPRFNQLRVVALYPYRESPLVPLLGPASLLSLAVPQYLKGEATVSLDIAALAASGISDD
ncbi:TadE/TadG family type IV pilus assembly protein [Pusillimonas noertemannii]|uniref:TadE/TadG family type IV pilus assembly protein n=1 Tax=Pusillimonas noertemannii TaxID=305977 RepID=UPI0002F02C7C|nr:TadE/TadG family type IV pilus assembly protein [Pusillimonas noertemannii]